MALPSKAVIVIGSGDPKPKFGRIRAAASSVGQRYAGGSAMTMRTFTGVDPIPFAFDSSANRWVQALPRTRPITLRAGNNGASGNCCGIAVTD